MTKKDYILLAKAIRDAKDSLTYASVNMPETLRSIETVADTIALSLQNDNSKFDKERFLTACGITE